MKQDEHELIVLQMMREIKARGVIFSGSRREVNFLLQNKMIERRRAPELSGSDRLRIRYTITRVGEGLIQHLINKHEKGNDNGTSIQGTTPGSISQD